MLKRGLIVVVVFYLLGVFGVASGYFWGGWDAEWNLDDQVFAAIKTGATWPLLVIEQIVGV